MLTILRGRANTGKTRRVLESICRKSDERGQILLVPDHASFAAEQDVCRYCGPSAAAKAEVLTFSRLSHRVVAETGGFEKISLDNGGKILMMQCAMRDTAGVLKVYHRPSQKVSFLKQFIELVEELVRYGISPNELMDYARQQAGDYGNKLQDIAHIYNAYYRYVAPGGVNLTDDMEKLCSKLAESGYVRGKDIYLDGFAHFTAQEYRAIATMLSQANSVTVTLLGEKDNTQDCFKIGMQTFTRLQDLGGSSVQAVELTNAADDTELRHLEQHFFGTDKCWSGKPEQVKICEAKTLYNEVEQAASMIRKLVADGTYRYRDIGIAVRKRDDYEAAVEHVFPRYEIPVYLSRRTDLLDQSLITVLVAALDAVTGGYEYEDMFRYLKSGFAGLTDEACDMLENYVIKWEIHGNMWIRDTAWTANPDGYVEGISALQKERLAAVNAAREAVRLPLCHLAEGLKQEESARGKMEVLYRFLEEIRLPQQLEQRAGRLIAAGQKQAADEYRQLWELICHVMDQFAEILGERTLEREEFVRLFKLVISQYSVGTIPVGIDRVSFSEVSLNDRHQVKCLFFLGCNDHVLPTVTNVGAILTEEERDRLRSDDYGLSPHGMDQLALELQNIYAVLVKPTRQLIVSYPTAGRDGSELRPAFIVARLKKLFPDLCVETAGSDKDYRLTAPAAALMVAEGHRDAALRSYFEQSGLWKDALAAVDRGSSMKRGKLSADAVESLYGKKIGMSASRIDKVSSCHFAYFMQYGLRARERTTAGLDPAQIGTFLHYVLEHVTRDAVALGGFAELEKKQLKELTRKHTDDYIAAAIGKVDDREARFRYLLRRLRRTVDTVVENVAEELSVSDFVPMAFELEFGGEGALDAITIHEGDTDLSVVGKVDRVDGWVKDGRLYLRVVDYKTGRKSFDLTDIYHGINIQLLLYLFALEREGKDYFGKEIVPAGVLYLPARDIVLNMDRATDEDTVRRAVEKELRRSGLLLHDREVLAAMEHDALSEPRYLPLALDKEHNITKGIASAEQLGRLSRYVDELLHQVAREIGGGNINADPCYYSEAENACTYCEFASACHFAEADESEQPRYVYPVKNDEFWQRLARKEGEEETNG